MIPGPTLGFLRRALHQSLFVLDMLLMEMLSCLPQLDALEFLHENEYTHGNVTAENIFVNPEDLRQVTARPSPTQGLWELGAPLSQSHRLFYSAYCPQRITVHHA